MSAPFIVNLYKPKNVSSYDIIRRVKPHFKKFGKIGHFGTLDPFADGVLMLGVAGGQRCNEYIHECLPKTYLAVGKLGVETVTGDLTVEPCQIDEGPYLEEVISKFDPKFIQETIQKKFLGEYMQAPPAYSAAKFQGKALHEYAREGVIIKKEPKKRIVHKIEVVSYEFPYLTLRCEVSSGTYIRTLFSDCAKELGTLGTLESLTRESVGHIHLSDSFHFEDGDISSLSAMELPEVLPFHSIIFKPKEATLYSNGVRLKRERAFQVREGKISSSYYWVYNETSSLLGMAIISDEGFIIGQMNFSA